MKIGTENTSRLAAALLTPNEAKTAKNTTAGGLGGLKKAVSFDLSKQLQSAEQMRKAAAWTRMAQLKSQLEALLQFSAGDVNPRLVAQLARELKSLVAQYGNPGGAMPTAVNIPTGSTGGSPADGDVPAADDVPAEAPAAAEAETKAVEGDIPSEAEIQGIVAAAAAAAEDASASDAQKPGTDESNDERRASISLKKPGDAADRAFFAEAKKLAQMIKSLLKGHAKKAVSDPQEAKDAKDAKRAVDEMEKAIRDAEGQLSQGPSVAVELAYDPGGIAVAESAGDAPACISVYG